MRKAGRCRYHSVSYSTLRQRWLYYGKVPLTHSESSNYLELLNYLQLTAVFTHYTDFKPGRWLGKVSFMFGPTVC